MDDNITLTHIIGGLAGGAFAYLLIAVKSERTEFWRRGSVLRSFWWWSFAMTILLAISAIDFLATSYRPQMRTVGIFASGYSGIAAAGATHGCAIRARRRKQARQLLGIRAERRRRGSRSAFGVKK